MRLLAFILLLLLSVSCSKKLQGPEELLKSFVQMQFKNNITKNKVADYLDGEILKSVESMDDQAFKIFSDLSLYKLKKTEINLKKCSDSGDEKCFITYTLSYLKKGDDKSHYLVYVKKIAELRNTGSGVWKIFNVNNVKTFIESKKPIDINGSRK